MKNIKIFMFGFGPALLVTDPEFLHIPSTKPQRTQAQRICRIRVFFSVFLPLIAFCLKTKWSH